MTVRLEKVSKTYKQVPVVNDLSFEIKQGAIFGLFASNGARRSTTIRMLITLLTRLSRGKVKVAGYDVQEGILVKQISERLKYDFFSTTQETNAHLNDIEDKTGMMIRSSFLKDILIKLTGHQL